METMMNFDQDVYESLDEDLNSRYNKNKAMHLIIRFIFIILICSMCFIFIIKAFFPNHSIPIFGFRMFLISDTRSMEPMFYYNDLVIVTDFDFDELRIGDIVAFEHQLTIQRSAQNKFITHQIVDEFFSDITGESLGFITAGINDHIGNDTRLLTRSGEDGTNKFIGIVSYHSTGWGRLLAFLTSPIGLLLIFLNSILITIISFFIRKMRSEQQ